MTGYKEKTITAVKWSSITIILGQISAIIFSIIKYRLLVPEDFGIMAIVTAIISIMRMIQTLGYGNVLIQKETINDILINSVFWLIVAVSIFLATCLILMSGWISDFYGVKILALLLPIAAGQFVFNSLILVQDSLLARDLKFKIKGLVGLVSTIGGSLIVIGFALHGYGVWSLVFGSIGGTVCTFILYLRYTKWTPSFMFSWSAIKSSVNFGLSLTLQKMLGQVTIAAPALIIGKFMGTDILGLFSFARRITAMIVGQVDAMISQVLFPLFSRLQNDKAKLVKGYLKVNHYVFLLVMPMIAGYIFISKDLIGIVYGEKWLDAVLISQILLIAIVMDSIYSKGASLITGIGRPDLLLRMELVLFVPMMAALVVAGEFGIVLLVCVLTAGKVVRLTIVQFILKNRVGLNFKEFFKCLKEPFFATLVMICILFVMRLYPLMNVEPKMSLIAVIVIGAVSYFLTVSYLDKRELISIVRLLFDSK